MSERDEPNVRVCPICTGNPGTLPVPNKKAIEDTILLGLALGSDIPAKFNFERKNYYYPDLPKAYQITSATCPPVVGGGLEIETEDGPRFVHLDHIHLEEDAGKLTHDKSGDFSLVDLNRAGTPLLEIVTQPDMASGTQAAEFMRNLQAILRALDIADADMEKGQMRCDANISVRPVGQKELGAKVEVKNINSFKMVQKAIEYEVIRQIEMVEEGKEVAQETRGWSEAKGKTLGQRSKEFANDYRYFPEPDIPPIEVGKGKAIDSTVITNRLPELPKEKKARFISEYGLAVRDAENIAGNLDNAKYFEEAIESIPAEAENSEFKKQIGKAVASFMQTELLGKLNGSESVFDTKVSPQNFASLIAEVRSDKISGKIAKEIFPEMLASGKAAAELIAEKGMSQISDSGELNTIVAQVLKDNKNEVERYRAGEKQLFGFFVGQVMKASKGQANPGLVNEILKKEL
jgi:aspartyl-tRNA(Asn)/glutamyl-tRNA(Gln) amidotransferase subunit B